MRIVKVQPWCVALVVCVALIGQQLQPAGHVAQQRSHFFAVGAQHPRGYCAQYFVFGHLQWIAEPVPNGIGGATLRALETTLHAPVRRRGAERRLHAMDNTEHLTLRTVHHAGSTGY